MIGVTKKANTILANVKQLEDMQKELLSANDGDDGQEAKANSLVQKDDEFNRIKDDLTKAMHAGEHKIQEFKDKKKKEAEDEDEKKASEGGILQRKRSDEDKNDFKAFLSGLAN